MTLDLKYIRSAEVDGNQVCLVESCPPIAPGQQISLNGELHRVMSLERVIRPGPNEQAGQYRVVAKPLRSFRRKTKKALRPFWWRKLWG